MWRFTRAWILVVLITLVCWIGGRFLLLYSSAQSACVNPGWGDVKWKKNTTVYYEFDPNSSFSNAEKNQIEDALFKWEVANQTNGSNVKFRQADATHPATLTVKTAQNQGAFGSYTYNDTNGDDLIDSAEITFDKQDPFFDPSLAGADTIFLKAALHEIGHLMG